MNRHETNITAHYRPGIDVPAGSNALTIGNFDGCHLGHQKLINRTLATAAQLKVNAASLTFSPRPDVFFHPERLSDGNLFTEEMKSRAFHEMNMLAVAEIKIKNFLLQSVRCHRTSSTSQY